jgi:hypothetical protein
VVVDSSKMPFDPVPLGLVPDVSAFVVQLVREPGAVVHSWRRRKPWTPDAPEEMPRDAAWWSALSWTARNVAAELVGVVGAPRLLVRYEDLVVRPRAALEAIIAFAREPLGELPLLDETTARLGPQHTVWGNADRFTSGQVTLRADDEWRWRLSRRDGVTVALLAGPLRRRYGYPLEAPAPAGHGSSS